jgi:hypothetical protein
MAQQRRTSATQGRTSATRGQAPAARGRTGTARKVTQTRRPQSAAQGQRQRATVQGGQRSRTALAQRRSTNGQRQAMPVQKSREELRREARLKRERQQKRKRRFTTCMLALAAVVIGVVLSLTVFFKISTIEVTGTSQYSKETILNVCGIDTGDNLFLVKKVRVADKIGRALPFTGEITVKRSFPNKIIIQVTDSVPSGAVAYEDGYALLNSDQKVLATVSTEEELYTLVAQQLQLAEEATTEESKTANNAEGEGSADNGTDDSTATVSVTTAAAQGNSASGVASASSSSTSTTKTSSTKSSTSASGTVTGKSTETASQTTTEEETTAASYTETTEANEDTSVSVTEEEIEAAKSQITMISGLTVSKAEAGKKITFEDNAAYTAYQDVAKALEEEEFTGVTGLDFTNTSDIRMEYEKRIVLKLGSASSLNRKLQLAEKVLEEQNAVSTELTGTIDLTISGRAYFSDEAESLTTTKAEEETSAVSETSEISESSTTS